MKLDRLEIEILLRILRDSRVEEVAIGYYGDAELRKLIEQLTVLSKG